MRLPIGIMEQVAAAGGGGSIPVYESSTTNTVAGNTSITMTKPGSVATGNLLILMGTTNQNDLFNTPSGWTVLQTSSGTGNNMDAFWRVADGTEGATIAFTSGSATNKACVYARISGSHATTPIDVTGAGVNGASASSHAIASVTTTEDNCLGLYFYGFDGGDGAPYSVSGTGWAEIEEISQGAGGANASMCWGQKDQASTGATGDATVSASATDTANYFQCAIAPA